LTPIHSHPYWNFHSRRALRPGVFLPAIPRVAFRTAPLLAFLLIACGDSAPEKAAPKVAVANPVERDVLEWDDYTGRIEATQSVEVRARVSGYLESVQFRPGQIVEAGALLFVIDPRPYQAELDRAKAAAAQSRSALELARNEAQRAGRLVARNAISQEEYEARTAGLRNAEAELQGADAAIRTAALDLEFTQIRSPIRGRVSRDLVNVGNLINGGTAGATLLTTVVSLDPIHCYFEVDERAYLRYADLARAGIRASSRDAANPVLLQLSDETDFPHVGKMDFVDNVIDPATGTMRGRAIFPNPDLKLTPGLFARVRLIGSGKYKATLLPDAAIGTDQAERFVLVVDAENQVARKKVVPGPMIEGWRIVREGVTAADRVVIGGLQAVHAGSVVDPQDKPLAVPASFRSTELPANVKIPDPPPRADAPAPER
jgi:RND family efflux transporter MFP subunit